jgi:hypothetical protein
MQEGSNEEVDQIKMSDNQESKWRPLSVSPMLVAIQPHRSAPNQLPAPSNEKVLGHERSKKVEPTETTDVAKSSHRC